MGKEELFKGLTPQQIKIARKCKSSEELLALAKSEGIELTDEQLAAVAGGACHRETPTHCPHCQSTDIVELGDTKSLDQIDYVCRSCGEKFWA